MTQQLSFLQDTEKKLSQTFKFQAEMIQNSEPHALTAHKFYFLQQMIHKHDLHPIFQHLHAENSVEVARRVCNFNSGSMMFGEYCSK